MFKKILFFIFLISSVSIPGYYFYQRSQSKKEESYPVNNKEEIQEEEVQEEEDQSIKNEEVALVEINGWLDCLLLNTIFFFLTIFFLYVLFPRGVQLMVTNETNKVAKNQLQPFFVNYLRKKGITNENINQIINENTEQCAQEMKSKNYDKKLLNKNYVCQLSSQPPEMSNILIIVNKLVHFCMIRRCLAQGKFFNYNRMFERAYISFVSDNLKMKFPIIFFIISFIIIQILLGYDLYFFLKSFWQVGFQRTFENLHWLDLFSIIKVFRRNSIIKKIAFLVSLILTTGFTFAWAFFKKYQPEEQNFLNSALTELKEKIDHKKIEICLTDKDIKELTDEAKASIHALLL